jgi:hypothetical protein
MDESGYFNRFAVPVLQSDAYSTERKSIWRKTEPLTAA